MCFALNEVQLKLIRHIGNVLVPRPSWTWHSTGGRNTSIMAGPGIMKCSVRCLCPPISSNTRVKFCKITSGLFRRQHTRPVEDDRVKNVSSSTWKQSCAGLERTVDFLYWVCNLMLFMKLLQQDRKWCTQIETAKISCKKFSFCIILPRQTMIESNKACA